VASSVNPGSQNAMPSYVAIRNAKGGSARKIGGSRDSQPFYDFGYTDIQMLSKTKENRDDDGNLIESSDDSLV
jgi:hypothetical protein